MTTDDKMREIEAALESLIDRAAVGRGVADQRIKVRDLIRAAIAPQADAEHEAKVEAWRDRLKSKFGAISVLVENGDLGDAIDECEKGQEAVDEALSLMRARPTTEAGPSALERDGTAAESFWQKAQARADMLQQQLDQCVRERDELAKSYRETIDDRDELLRIINDAFLSLHIPGSTKAFDGRNLVVHAEDSAEVAMVLRAERDEARRERDAAIANTSLAGYCLLVKERDAARRDLASLMAAAKSLTDDPNACWEDFLAAVDAIARAQSGLPAPCKCSMTTRLVGDGCSTCNPDWQSGQPASGGGQS